MVRETRELVFSNFSFWNLFKKALLRNSEEAVLHIVKSKVYNFLACLRENLQKNFSPMNDSIFLSTFLSFDLAGN